MKKEEILKKAAELKDKAVELKDKAAELKPIMELKSPEEIKAATEYSVRGFRAVLFGEKAFRTDLVVFFLSSLAAFILPVTWCERAVMIYTVFIALMAEIINTAIETVVDRISTEYNELSGKAKDIASSIVFTAFFGAGICWSVILLGLVIKWIF